MHHRPAKGDGRLAKAMQNSNSRDAIHRSLLGCGIRHSGTSGFGGVPGECPGHEESARTQERRAGESMVDEATHLRTVAKFLSAIAEDPHDADLLRSEEHTSELQSRLHLVCRLLLEKKKKNISLCDTRYI